MSYDELILTLMPIRSAGAFYLRHPSGGSRLLRAAIEDARPSLDKADGREPVIDRARGQLLAKCNGIVHALDRAEMELTTSQPSWEPVTINCQELVLMIDNVLPYPV